MTPDPRRSWRLTTVAGLGLALLLAPQDAAAKKKKGPPPPPPVGWQTEEGWSHPCYFAPQWESLDLMHRMQARSDALDELVKQWGGSMEDGVMIGEQVAEDLETVLLGRPDKIEAVVNQNQTTCIAAAKGGDDGPWTSWVKGLPAKLTLGECSSPPLDYTLFDYLDIGTGWQRQIGICKGDRVEISGTERDRYRVEEGGPWINVAGDRNKPTSGQSAMPCNIEGCYLGMLIMKYTTDSGVETIYPVPEVLDFTAPEHGTIEFRINDTQYFDNVWYKNGSIIDHTALQVGPPVN